MIKIDYRFTNVTPLHTGSDKDTGTVKTLRRQKVIVPQLQQIIVSRPKQARIDMIVEILYAIHQELNFDSIKGKRLMNIWSEWQSKILRAASSPTKESFFSELCRSWDVRAVADESVISHLDTLSSFEILETIRQESNYIILKLRQRAHSKVAPSFTYQDAQQDEMTQTFAMIPLISGNSIRGVLRRLAMYDFTRISEITRLSKDDYHMLFTGGILNDSTQYEDLSKRESLIALCPMLGVFGSAIGNMTIEGQLSVGMAVPLCHEVGTGNRSYWEYLDTVFQTRLDSSKTENSVEIVGAHDNPDQMKYEYEVFSPGTPFTHAFRMLDFSPLAVSAFWRVIRLFKEAPFVGGMWAVGNAEIDLSALVIPDGADDLYLEHLQINKSNIQARFNVPSPA